MNGDKYIGLDVHQATISVAVLDSAGKLLMESVIETKAATILQFIQGLRGNLYVTFEEGTCAAWLYDLLKPHVTKVVVCDPRKNALLKAGNKSDRIDARKLAELLRSGLLSPVYQGEAEAGLRTLKELARSYLTTAKDLTRVMNRLKALYRSRAIFCVGRGGLRAAPSRRVVAKAAGSWRPPSGRATLPTTRSAAGSAPGSPPGTVGREPETSRDSRAAKDSIPRPGSSRLADRFAPDAPSFPHQAATLGLQRSGLGDAHQCGLSLRGRPTTALEETFRDQGSE